MEKNNLKGNAEAVDICDLRKATERTELGLRVSKIEQIQKMILFFKSVLRIHSGHLFVVFKIPFQSATDEITQTLQFRMMTPFFGLSELTDLDQPKSDF